MKDPAVLLAVALVLLTVVFASAFVEVGKTEAHMKEELRALRLAADRYHESTNQVEALIAENNFMSGEVAFLHCKTDILSSVTRLGGWQSDRVLDGLRHCQKLRSKRPNR